MCLFCRYVFDDWTIDHMNNEARKRSREENIKYIKILKEQIAQYELWLARPEDGWSSESIREILVQLKNAQYVAGRYL